MLNRYLTEKNLQSDLKEFLDSYHFMFTQFQPEKNISIFQNKKLLGLLHHSLNIEKYEQVSFRKKLFVSAPDDKILNFAKRRNIKYDTFEETQTLEFRNKLASFQWGDNNDTKIFVDAFGYDKYLIPSNSKKIDSEEWLDPSSNPFKQLKKYQAEIVFRALEQVEIANSKFLIHMPTGSGKTRVAMEIIVHFLNEEDDRVVIWLADKVELCEQAMETFVSVWSHLGKRKLKICRIWGKNEIPNISNQSGFIVAMYQKIRAPIQSNSLKIKADLIVPDEAHNAISLTYSEIIHSLKDLLKKQTRIMGLTATPGRGSGSISENQKLSNFFSSSILEIPTKDGIIKSLQRQRILSLCFRDVLNTNIEYTLSKQEWTRLSKSFEREFPDKLLEEIANDEKRNMKIILKLKKLAEECEHVLVFCGSKKQSKLLSGFMLATGYLAAHVDGTSPKNYRKDVVNKFRNGEIQFVFNYGVFTTGFDVPKIDAVVIARPTASVVLYGQMIGRGMRGTAVGGTHAFQLIDVVDNIITEYGGLDNVYDYFSEYWEME